MGLAGAVWAQLPVAEFTLAWDHSVEKVRWEEDYRVTAAGLLLGEARVRGSGAGMEPPANAVLRDGVWHYRTIRPPLQPLRLGRTPEAGDYQLCTGGTCRPFSSWLGPPSADRPWVELWGCPIGRTIPEPHRN